MSVMYECSGIVLDDCFSFKMLKFKLSFFFRNENYFSCNEAFLSILDFGDILYMNASVR